MGKIIILEKNELLFILPRCLEIKGSIYIDLDRINHTVKVGTLNNKPKTYNTSQIACLDDYIDQEFYFIEDFKFINDR